MHDIMPAFIQCRETAVAVCPCTRLFTTSVAAAGTVLLSYRQQLLQMACNSCYDGSFASALLILTHTHAHSHTHSHTQPHLDEQRLVWVAVVELDGLEGDGVPRGVQVVVANLEG